MPNDSPQLVLAIDGGGTKTVCQLVAAQEAAAPRDASSVLGLGRAGASNAGAVGIDAACWAVDTAIDGAFQNANLPRATVAACVMGLAGAGRKDIQQAMTAWAEERGVATRVRVVPDCELVLAAGAPTGAGVALIAGTGSLAFGRSERGRTARAGGWGYLLGDNGSGFAIGRAAVQAVLTANDEGTPEDDLARCVCEHFQSAAPSHVISDVYESPDARAALAALAPAVLRLAEESDAAAMAIVEAAAQDLAKMIATVVGRLALDRNHLPLSLAGGVLIGSAVLRQKLLERMRCEGIEVEVSLVPAPVAGAVQLALGEVRP